MSHIFISYSRDDKKVVSQFTENLQQNDFIIWQDVNDIKAGENWSEALLSAIEKSAVMLVFWTQSASNSEWVKKEIEHADKHSKHIIPIWLEEKTPLHKKLSAKEAVKTANFSSSAQNKIIKAILDVAPRIQREVMGFQTDLPMNRQDEEKIRSKLIGEREYRIFPLVESAYSSACVIAEAGTIVRQLTDIQLIIQNTGDVNFHIVRDAFQAIGVDNNKPVVGLYVTGARNPANEGKYWVDVTNVAHYSDMIGTVQKAIAEIGKGAVGKQTFQVFQKTLVEISFLLGTNIERWIPLQLYKYDGERYVRIIDIPSR